MVQGDALDARFNEPKELLSIPGRKAKACDLKADDDPHAPALPAVWQSGDPTAKQGPRAEGSEDGGMRNAQTMSDDPK